MQGWVSRSGQTAVAKMASDDIFTGQRLSRCFPHIPLVIRPTLLLVLPFDHNLQSSSAMVQLEKVSSNRVSTGTLTKYKFPSSSLNLDTQFNLFVPSSASASSPVPVLFYLAGLTCNEDTGAQKGGILNTAGKEGIAVVFPDTSPRGAGVEGEDDDWQLGTGETCPRGTLAVQLTIRCWILPECHGGKVEEALQHV